MAEENKNTEPEVLEPEKEKEHEKTPTIDELSAQIKALQTQLDKTKKAMDTASSDAASWRKKYNATLSEAERAEAERAEAERKLREENEALKRDKVVSAYSNKALALGYDAELANATAEAMANGDMDTVFASIGQLVQNVKIKTAAENFGKQPPLSTGTPPTKTTLNLEEENKYRRWAGLPLKK